MAKKVVNARRRRLARLSCAEEVTVALFELAGASSFSS